MSTYRRMALVLIVVVVAIGVYHGLRPYDWTSQLVTPTGVPSRNVNLTCGPPWGSAYVHGQLVYRYPIAGTPCGQRQEYRVMVLLDIVLGAVAFVFVAGFPRRLRSQASLA